MVTSARSAVEFLTWLFGETPNDNIYLYAERKKNTGEAVREFLFYKTPAKVNNTWWEEEARYFRITFCTQELVKDKSVNNGVNVRATPALWFDVDGCKKITHNGAPVVAGEEFLRELQLQLPDVSCWTRSSQHGLQGFYKLDEPFQVGGDKKLFDERLQPLLLDIAWNIGADMQVATIGRLMRLPGSLNLKDEYKNEEPFLATALINPEHPVHSLSELGAKFTQDFDECPRLVTYTVFKLMQDIWEPDDHHNAMLALAGSVRRAGLDKASCLRLFKQLHVALVDSEMRTSEVETTYSKSLEDPIATLHKEYKSISEAVDSALNFWAKLKLEYSKKRGIEWHPEVDPTQKKDGDRPFFVSDNVTWYKDKDGVSQVLANFNIRITQKIIKASGGVVWHAQINKPGSKPLMIEIPAALQVTFTQFMTIKPMLTGLVFQQTGLWMQYINYLDEVYADVPTVQETLHYGILGLDNSDAPFVLLLPGDDNPSYTWHNPHDLDTARPGMLRKEINSAQAKDYLSGMAEYYKVYQEATYLWPALGWFCACPMAAFFRKLFGGFPIMLVTGLKGIGKSTLVDSVLAKHFGCGETVSFATGTTTLFALRKMLAANNVCPMILDEFKDDEESRTKGIQGIIRSNWSGYAASFGKADGGVNKDKLIAPLCIIGEHSYQDPATVERTFSVRVSPAHIKHVRTLEDEELVSFKQAASWLHQDKNDGMLGTILLSYIERHPEEVLDIIKKATARVEETCGIPTERKRTGYIAALAGTYLLNRVCKEYGVGSITRKSTVLDAIYAADVDVLDVVKMGGNDLKTLFAITDKLIIDGLRHNIPFGEYLYGFDPHDENIICFQVKRWYEEVQSRAKASQSAALKHERAFHDLLRENMLEAEPIVLSFPERTGVIKLNLRLIGERYMFNTDNWRPSNESAF